MLRQEVGREGCHVVCQFCYSVLVLLRQSAIRYGSQAIEQARVIGGFAILSLSHEVSCMVRESCEDRLIDGFAVLSVG